MTAIAPTIGRRLYYTPSQYDVTAGIQQLDNQQKLDAGVVFIHPDGTLTLSVTDHCGSQFVRAAVPLVQAGETPPADVGYAEWMPYQLAQAANTAATPAPAPATTA